MKKLVYVIGNSYFNNSGDEYTIITRNLHTLMFKIAFTDGTVIERVALKEIKNGVIKNPNKPSFHHIGYIGQGMYKSSEGNTLCKAYSLWGGILGRCYDAKYQQKQPTYKGCLVDERWHNFQNFAKWFEENYNPEIMQGWQLDKDILVKGNKIYSSETCCFVPQEINKLFTKSNVNRGDCPIGMSKRGDKFRARYSRFNRLVNIGTYNTIEEAFEAYKIAKEEYIKEVAEKYKSQISEKVYRALINYQVEITD